MTTTGAPPPEVPLAPADAARWHMATARNPMVITALLLTEQRLTLEGVADVVQGKLLRVERFRQRIVSGRRGRPRWTLEEPFSLGAHVYRLPGIPVGDAELARIAGARMTAALPDERSPWTFELVDRAGGGSALVVRVHHGIADGQALVAVLGELADRPPPAARGPAGGGGPRRWPSLRGLGRLLVDRDEPATLLRGDLRGDKRVAWSEPLPLGGAKALARQRGHHLIDVLLAAVAGALARYLRLRGGSPADVRALMPVATAPRGARRSGNHYASVSVSLPLTEPDPYRRMSRIAAEIVALRSGGDSHLAAALLGWVGSLAPGVERRAVAWRARKVSLVASSLRGPDQKVRIAGAEVSGIVVWAPAPASVALSLALFGYGDELRLGVAADAGVIADPLPLVAAFEEEMNALLPGARRSASLP
jgi:diacylglycerol O-acyltransferase